MLECIDHLAASVREPRQLGQTRELGGILGPREQQRPVLQYSTTPASLRTPHDLVRAENDIPRITATEAQEWLGGQFQGFASQTSLDVQSTQQSNHPAVDFLIEYPRTDRERMPVRVAGGLTPATLLLELLRDAEITVWPPGWAVSDRHASLWALAEDLAFPLVRTPTPGRWLAVTCLRRERR